MGGALGAIGGAVNWLGETQLSLDDKNRVVIPRRLQAGLERDDEGRVTAIVTRGFEGCLFVFAVSAFERVLARMRTQAFDGAEERRMQRLFFANAHRSTLDSAGRLLLPEKLRALVGITKEVVVVGLVDRLEIWPRQAWEDFENANTQDFDKLDRILLSGGEAVTEPT